MRTPSQDRDARRGNVGASGATVEGGGTYREGGHGVERVGVDLRGDEGEDEVRHAARMKCVRHIEMAMATAPVSQSISQSGVTRRRGGDVRNTDEEM